MQNPQVVHHHVGVGEVDDRLRAGRDQLVEVVARVDLRDQLECRRPPRPPGRPRADLAAGTQHTDLELFAHGPNLAASRPRGGGA